jgi:hypothetical protein
MALYSAARHARRIILECSGMTNPSIIERLPDESAKAYAAPKPKD